MLEEKHPARSISKLETNYREKRASHKLQNPKLLEISFKSFRHGGNSMLVQYTKGNVLTIKKMLRHKKIENTIKYIHTIQFKDENFE
jgi:integrase